MSTIFSARTRAMTWRKLWVWLAEAEQELGLPISDEALAQMRANVDFTDEDFKVAAEEVSLEPFLSRFIQRVEWQTQIVGNVNHHSEM